MELLTSVKINIFSTKNTRFRLLVCSSEIHAIERKNCEWPRVAANFTTSTKSKIYVMDRNTNSKGGFWMLVQDLDTELAKEANEKQPDKEILDDEFFPDTSF